MSDTATSATPAGVQQQDNDELATQLYDMLMRNIEPDLLSYNIPKLDEYYASESEEEHEERMKRYEQAYEEFEYVFQDFMNEVQDEVRVNKRSALVAQEAENREEEEGELANLEAALSSS